MNEAFRRICAMPASVWIATGFFVACAIIVPRFFTPGNLENVVRITAILAIVSCGQAIVLILGGIEFSFGSSVALASVVAAMLLPSYGTAAAFAAALLTVLAVSLANASLVAFMRLPAVIVTLGTLMIAHGLAASLAGGLPVDAIPNEFFKWPASGKILWISAPVWLAALALSSLALILAKSSLGRRFILVGANSEAARLAGIEVARTKFLGYVLAGIYCGAAAIVLTSRVGSGQPNLMPDLPFQTIAACAIGGIPLTGGRGSALQVLAGVAVIAMLNNAVVLLNYPAATQLLLTAAVIVGSVAVQSWRIGSFGALLPGMRGARR